MESNFFHYHVHSHHSVIDGMPKVPDLIAKAKRMGHPAIGITDHGNMSATVKGYKAAKAAGLKFFPGFEGYLIDPAVDDWENPPKGTKVGRYHFGIQALTERGYMGLVKLTSLSHTRPRFNRFPRLTLGDLAKFGREYGDDVVLYTGCYFGYVQQMLVKDGIQQGIPTAKRIIEQYSTWFPHTFVELQHHNIDHYDEETNRYISNDGDIVNALFDIAQELDLPVVAGQDSHYLDQTNKSAHNLMKKMVYAGADDSFPGDSFHLASTEWVAEHYTDEQWDAIEEGFGQLLDLHDLSIAPLDTFTPDVPKISKAPVKKLRRLCEDWLSRYTNGFGSTKYQHYVDRMEEELTVINTLHMAEYFLIVRDYVEWCEQNDVFVEARGSANGSLVCYALNITQIDPIIHKTDFPRFLSVDRIKPPDIDMDVDDSKRPALMNYLLSKYNSVQIGTFGKLGMRYDEREDHEGGSALQTWLSSKRRATFDYAEEYLTRKHERRGDKPPTQAEIKAYGSAVFRNKYGHIEDVRDVEQVDPKEYKALRQIIEMDSVYKSYGVHAGGVLLSGEHIKIEDYIPTMLVASSDTRVSQYDMDDVEEFGLLKMDILGQATLRTMKIANELIGKDDVTDFTWIPNDDSEALKVLRSGRTGTGVFHQEGYALPNETPVLTPTGWTPIADLCIGDEVMDPDGGVATVTGVFPQGVTPVYEVALHGGKKVEATNEHLWNIRINNGSVQTVNTQRLGEYLNTTQRPKLVGLSPVTFEPKDLPVDPYTLGLLIGDGALTNPSLVRYITDDPETVQSILDANPGLIAKREGKSLRYYFRGRRKRAQNGLKAGLAALGLMGKSAHEKWIPDAYKRSSIDQRVALLRGLIDTDGSVRGSTARYTTTSERLAHDVVDLVRSLGGEAQFSASDREPAVMASGQTSALRRIYVVNIGALVVNPARLERKASAWTPPLHKVGLGVQSVKYTRDTETTCISVTSESECYITKDYIVTHNTKAKGGRSLPIRSTKDCVLWQALYMPGAMDTGQTAHVEKARRDSVFRQSQTYIHPIFERHLKDTYGAYVYQNQVMSILRDLGMDIPSINVFLKVVKASGRGAQEKNRVKLEGLAETYHKLCIKAGINDADERESWEALCGFGAYGFNKNHAAGYGIRSYRCAYLKAHYPLEFMTAILQTWVGRDKEPTYIKECRRINLRILSPHVNISTDTWEMDTKRGGVRRGLTSIAGIGVKSAQAIAEQAPFTSVEDMVARVNGRALTGGKQYVETEGRESKGIIEKLDQANALDGLDISGNPTLFDNEE